MKALKLTALLLFAAGTIFAQKNNVETASIAITKYASRTEESKEIRTAYLKEAKEFIDKAQLHESTSNYDKMWLVRGKVYFYIYLDTLGNKGWDEDAIAKSTESLLKAKETDTKGKYEKEINRYLSSATAMTYNEGIAAYQKGNYDRAMKYFDLALKAIPQNDQALLKRNNVDAGKVRRMAATTAIKKGDNETAKKYLQMLMDESYADPIIYIDMKDLLLSEGDTTGALKYLGKGRSMYEDNMTLILEELNTYLKLDRPNILIDRLKKAIEADPYNAIFYFNLGYLYDKKGDNVETEEAKQAAKDSAVVNYEKALELNPSYFDALFNLGALYYNQGAEWVNQANSYGLKEQAKADAALAKADGYFQKAQPHLELAHELKEDDKIVAQSLMQLYLRSEQTEKYKEIKAKFQ